MGDATRNEASVLSGTAVQNSEQILSGAALGNAEQLVGGILGGPKPLLSGLAAAEAVARLLPSATTITVLSSLGPVELRPGTIWSGDRMLVRVDTVLSYYTAGDQLYEIGTSTFIRAEYFNALSQGAAQASAVVYLAQIEMAFLTGLLVPWQVLLGVTAAGLGLTLHHHRQETTKAMEVAPRLIKSLNTMRQSHPTLFEKLRVDS